MLDSGQRMLEFLLPLAAVVYIIVAVVAFLLRNQERMEREIAQRVTRIANVGLENWFAEAPTGTRPLNLLQPNGAHAAPPIVLTMTLNAGSLPWCGAGLMLAQ